MFSKTSQFSNKLVVKRILVILSILFLVFYKSPSSSIDYTISSIFNEIRGEVQPDTNIILITISADDISQIGPWPIKRSYYALLVNSLTKLKAKKIGLEVFLTAKFATQTLYDNLLVNEAEKSGNVVFSALAGGINEKDKKYITDSLSFPSPKLLNDNLKIGHINYISEPGIQIPIQIEKGKIHIKKPKVIAKEGEKISQAAADIMSKLDIKPFSIGFVPISAFDTKENKLYLEIVIDREGTLNDLKDDYRKALGFAVGIGYVSQDTIKLLIAKAASHEKALNNLVEKNSPIKEGDVKKVNNKDSKVQDNSTDGNNNTNESDSPSKTNTSENKSEEGEK